MSESIRTVLMGNLLSKFTVRQGSSNAKDSVDHLHEKKMIWRGFRVQETLSVSPSGQISSDRASAFVQSIALLQSSTSAFKVAGSPDSRPTPICTQNGSISMVSLSALPQQPASTCLILNCSHQKMQSVLKKWMRKRFHYLQF